jgi:HEAT repeat protein
MTIGIFTTDTEGIVRSWDDRLAAMTRIPEAAARGRELSELIPDLEARGLGDRFRRVLSEGTVETLSPLFHRYLIPCPPAIASSGFEYMQQKVTIAPLQEDTRIVGAIVTVEDVTERLEREREGGSEASAAAVKAPAAAEAKTRLEDLRDDRWDVRRAAVDSLVRESDSDTMVELLRSLRAEHANPSVLNSILQVLVLSNLDPLPALIECLRDPEVDLRIYAALTLGDRRDARGIPALIEALDDPDANVRYHAIDALKLLKAREAVESIAAIAESEDFFLAFPALEALIRIGDGTIAPRLVPLLDRELLYPTTAQLLGTLGDASVVPPMVATIRRWCELPSESSTAPPDSLAPPLSERLRAVVGAIAAIYRRYDKNYGEGSYIVELTRHAFGGDPPALMPPRECEALLCAISGATGSELSDLVLLLGWFQGEAIETVLVELLNEPSVRNQALYTISRYGRRICERVLEQLEAPSSSTRKAAAIALGRIGDPRAVGPLTELLHAEPELGVAAANALAQIGDAQAFESLLELLGHPEASLRLAAIGALNSLGHPDLSARIFDCLGNFDPYVRESAVKIAGYFAFPNCFERLFACLTDPHERVRRAAIEQLPLFEDLSHFGQTLPHACEILRQALREETPPVRAAAAHSLGHFPWSLAFEPLREALDDEDPWVRYHAVRSLIKSAKHHIRGDRTTAIDGEAIALLLDRLQHDPANPVRAASAEALGHFGAVEAVPLLVSLSDSDEGGGDVARAAVQALGEILSEPESSEETEEALAALLKVLRSRDPQRRLHAIRASVDCPNPEIEKVLRWQAATENDPMVFLAAIDALSRRGTDSAIATLIELTLESRCREACIDVLAHREARDCRPLERRIAAIAQGLSHRHPEARRATIEVLARLKHPEASALVLSALEDGDASVRLSATVALGHLGNPCAETKLALLARHDPDIGVRRAAQKILQY